MASTFVMDDLNLCSDTPLGKCLYFDLDGLWWLCALRYCIGWDASPYLSANFDIYAILDVLREGRT